MVKAVVKHWKAVVAAQLKGARADAALLNNETYCAVGCVGGLIVRRHRTKPISVSWLKRGAKI